MLQSPHIFLGKTVTRLIHDHISLFFLLLLTSRICVLITRFLWLAREREEKELTYV